MVLVRADLILVLLRRQRGQGGHVACTQVGKTLLEGKLHAGRDFSLFC